jgi:hypothetical protein
MSGEAAARAVYAVEEPVGFVMVSWNVRLRPPDIIGPWFLWKMIIDQRFRGHGYAAEPCGWSRSASGQRARPSC